jgi:hypothetical protein
MGHSAKAWRRVAAMLTVAVALVLPATASAAGKTVRTTVHVPATALNNLCYGGRAGLPQR